MVRLVSVCYMQETLLLVLSSVRAPLLLPPPLPIPLRRPCQAGDPHPEPQWSGGHRGLALYVSRLLTPVWDVKVITPSRGNAAVWKARLTEQTMSVSVAARLRGCPPAV